MAEVIRLSDRKPIPPKVIEGEHAGQKYKCTFDPNAPKHERWVWEVNYVRVYPHYGSCPTPEAAASRARKLIHSMNMHVAEWEENQ